MDTDSFTVPIYVIAVALAIFILSGVGVMIVFCTRAPHPEAPVVAPSFKDPPAADPLTEARDHLHKGESIAREMDDLPDRRWQTKSHLHHQGQLLKHQLVHTSVEPSSRSDDIPNNVVFDDSPYARFSIVDGLVPLPLPPPLSLDSTSIGPESVEEARSRSRSPPASIVEVHSRSRSRSPIPQSPVSFVDVQSHSGSHHLAVASPRMHVPYALRSPARPVPRPNSSTAPPVQPVTPALTPSRTGGATDSMPAHFKVRSRGHDHFTQRLEACAHRPELRAQPVEHIRHTGDSIPVHLVEQPLRYSRAFVIEPSRHLGRKQTDVVHETIDFCHELWCEPEHSCDCRPGFSIDGVRAENVMSNSCWNGASPACTWRSQDKAGKGSVARHTWHSRGSGWVRPLQSMHTDCSVDRRNMV